MARFRKTPGGQGFKSKSCESGELGAGRPSIGARGKLRMAGVLTTSSRGCGRIVGPFGPVRSPYVQPRLKGRSPPHAEAHRRRREDRQDVRRSRQNPAPLGGGRGQAAAEVPRSQVRALRRRGPGQGDGDGARRRVLQGDRGSARRRKPRCCTILAERRRDEGSTDGRSAEKTRGRRAGVRRLRGQPRGEDPAARAGERHPEGGPSTF